MSTEEKLKFILNLFKSERGEIVDSIYSLSSFIESYVGEGEFPNDIELSPQEIRQIVDMVCELQNRSSTYNTKTGEEILNTFFMHVSDESKMSYIKSEESKIDGYRENIDYRSTALIFDTIDEERKEELFNNMTTKEEAEIRVRLGMLNSQMPFCWLVSDIERDKIGSHDFFENIRFMMALRDIDVDLSQFEERDSDVFFNSKEFSELVNVYYQGLGDYERREMIRRLSFSIYDHYGNDFAYFSPEFKPNLHIFNLIESDDKYKRANMNVLAGVLEHDMVEDSERYDILRLMFDINKRDPYVKHYFESIRDGRHDPLTIPNEQIAELLDEATKPYSKWDDFAMGILGVIPVENLKDYLLTCPGNISFCMDVLIFDDTNDLLERIDDEKYKARLLMSITDDIGKISDYFPHIEDPYIRAQITTVKTQDSNDRFVSMEDTFKKIDAYLQVRNEFLNLPEDERVEYLCSLSLSDTQNSSEYDYKTTNEVKYFLLEHITDPEERMAVIESMESYIDPDISEYVQLAQTMILEFVEDKFDLSTEEYERMQVAFSMYDVYFTSYNDGNVNGKARYVDRDITIANHSRGDTQNILLDMIHEYSHVFSMLDFVQTGCGANKLYEEGMADTFSEQVTNYYFGKNPSVDIAGETFTPTLPLINQSSYTRENSQVKTMLYPLEASGEDLLAIQEYLFGAKWRLFDMVMGGGYSDRFNYDYAGNPINPVISDDELLERHAEEFRNGPERSFYFIKNHKISDFITRAQAMQPTHGIEEIEEQIEEQQTRFGQVAASSYALERDIGNEEKRHEQDSNGDR